MPATQTPTDGPYAYPDSDRPGARSNTETTHHLTKIREYSEGDVAAAAVALGFELSAEEVAGFASVIQTTIEGLNLLGSYESIVAAGADRDSWVPQDNPYRAWYRQTEIQENDEGPLRGIRVAFKDNILVAGVPLSNGTSIFDGYRPVRDATVVTRVIKRGGTVAGKAVCEPMSLSGTGDTAMTGAVLNPYDPTRLSGGSSSGSAVLVATGAVEASVGADNGGSVRIPASWCGVCGLKPTRGAIPYTGVLPWSKRRG